MSWQRIGLTSTYVLLATASLALLQWAMMAIIARMSGPATLGHYALAQAFATPASYLAWLSIRQQYLVSRDWGAEAADFAFLRIFAPAAVFGVLLSLLAAIYGWGAFLLICLGVFALKYVEGFYDLAYGRMQRSGDVTGLVQTASTRCLASLVLFAAVYLLTRDLPVALLALAIASIAIYQLQRPRLGASAAASHVFDLSRPVLMRRALLAGTLAPLALANVVMSLTTNAPRFLIEWEFGATELGLFAAVFHFITIGALATGSIGHAILPGLAAAVRANEPREFWPQLFWPMAVIQAACALGAVAASFIGAELLWLVYGSTFADQGGLLVAAAIASGPIYCASLAANGCYAAQLRRALLTTHCMTLLVVVVVTMALVPAIGVVGAIAGIMIAAIVQLLACIGLLNWFWRRQRSLASRSASNLGGLVGPGE